MPDTRDEQAILVVGLGRFSTAIATTLDDLGRDVLVVEKNPDTAQRWSHRLRVVEGDATSMEVLDQVGAGDFTVAVVGVGTSLEASVLVTANLVDLGFRRFGRKRFRVRTGGFCDASARTTLFIRSTTPERAWHIWSQAECSTISRWRTASPS